MSATLRERWMRATRSAAPARAPLRLDEASVLASCALLLRRQRSPSAWWYFSPLISCAHRQCRRRPQRNSRCCRQRYVAYHNQYRGCSRRRDPFCGRRLVSGVQARTQGSVGPLGDDCWRRGCDLRRDGIPALPVSMLYFTTIVRGGDLEWRRCYVIGHEATNCCCSARSRAASKSNRQRSDDKAFVRLGIRESIFSRFLTCDRCVRERDL